MRLLELHIVKTGTTSPIDIVFEPGLSDLSGRNELKDLLLSELLADAFFSQEFLRPDVSFLRVDFEVFQKRYALEKNYAAREKECYSLDSSEEKASLNDVLSGTVVKNADVVNHMLIFRSDLFSQRAATQEDTGGLAQKLKSLRSELDAYFQFDELNRVFDEHQSRLFEIQEKIRLFEELEKKKKLIHTSFDDYKAVDHVDLSEDLASRLKNFAKVKERFEDQNYAFEQKLSDHYEALDRMPKKLWYQQKEAWVGFAASLASFMVTALLRQNVWFLYLGMLGSILPLSLIVWAVVKSNREQEAFSRVSSEIRELEQKKVTIQKKQEIELSPVTTLFKKTGIHDPMEILDMVQKRREILNELSDLEAQVSKLSKEKSHPEYVLEKKKLEQESKWIEKKLSDLPPLNSDLNSIQIEIENLEKELGMDSASLLKLDQKNTVDRTDKLFKQVSFAIGVSEEKLLPVSIKGIEKALTALTHGKVTSLIKGEAEWLFQSGSRYVGLGEFQAPVQRTVFFAVQYTLWQLVSHRFPIFCMVKFAADEDAQKGIMRSAMMQLAKKMQVIFLP